MLYVVLLCLGALMLYFAYAIGVKQKIAYLHDYHHMHVENKKAYTTLMGRALLIIAISFFTTVCILPLSVFLSMLVMMLGLLTGIIMMFFAQYKYNGSIFS